MSQRNDMVGIDDGVIAVIIEVLIFIIFIFIIVVYRIFTLAKG